MEKNALTDLSVQRLKPGTYMDAKTPAFGIRIGKHRKTWIATKGKERRVVTLGHYPAMSLAEARRKALATFVAPSVSTGSITFPEAREAFLAQDRWRVGSKRVLASNLSKFHWTGPLARITHEQVAQTIDAIDKPSARAHALKDIRTFFNWCVPRYLAASPAAGLRMPTQRSRDRVLTDEELATIWNSCEGDFGTIVKLLLLTGQRRGEVGSLRWSHVGNDRITLPPQSTKNNREHSFPLTPLARSLLPDRGDGFVFPNGLGNGFTAYAFNHQRLLKRSKTADWVLHDLRRTVATNLAALGVPIHVTEKLLNHLSGSLSGVAGIYNRHSYFSEMQEALLTWERRLEQIVGATPEGFPEALRRKRDLTWRATSRRPGGG